MVTLILIAYSVVAASGAAYFYTLHKRQKRREAEERAARQAARLDQLTHPRPPEGD